MTRRDAESAPAQRHRGHSYHIGRVAQLPFFDDGRVVSGRRGDLPAFWYVLEALWV